MRVLLLNDGGYGNDADVTYPVEVDGSPSHNTRGDLCGVDVKKSVLRGKGFSINDTGNDTLYFSFTWSECEQVEASERRYSVHGKCCNQFGERDEIQAIIDKLRADVAERDKRIKALEGVPTLQGYIDNMVDLREEASLKGENGIYQMCSFSVKTACTYLSQSGDDHEKL